MTNELSTEQITGELNAIGLATKPLYAELEVMGDGAYWWDCWKNMHCTPAAQVIEDQLKPLTARAHVLTAELKRREQEAANKRMWAARDARTAIAQVFQRRNGWEIVKDEPHYILRDPDTKEEVYRGSSLRRVREVADESKPEARQ